MKVKKYAVFAAAICMMISLVACGTREQDIVVEDSALEEYEIATPDPDAIKEVKNEKVVLEFGNDIVDFPNADLRCYLPKGFEESEYEGEYLYKTYPDDVSSINHVVTDTTQNPTSQTKEEFTESLKADFNELYGTDIDFQVTQYDKIEVEGRPGLWIMYNYDYRGEHYYVLHVKIFSGHQIDEMVYFEGPGAEWMDKFVESAESLTFEEYTEQDTED